MADRDETFDIALFTLTAGLIFFCVLDAIAFSYAAQSVPSLFLNLFATTLGVPVYFFCYWFFEVRHDQASFWACSFGRNSLDKGVAKTSTISSMSLEEGLLHDENSLGNEAAQKKVACGPPRAIARNCGAVVFLAALSTLSSAMLIVGASHTAPGLQALLYQLSIPMNVGASAFILGYRASLVEYVGAVVVFGGIVVVYLPQLLPKDGGDANPRYPLFNIIYALAIVPSSVSSVLSERALKTWDGVSVLGFSAILQLVSLPLTLLTVPLYTLPILGDYAVPFHDIGDSYAEGARCVFEGGDRVSVELACKWGLPASLLAVCSNAGISVIALYIVRRYSASSLVVVAALSLPITELVFNIPGLAPSPNWSWELFVGLTLIACGNVIYKRGKRPRQMLHAPASAAPVDTAAPASECF